jgi:hypothetical protein
MTGHALQEQVMSGFRGNIETVKGTTRILLIAPHGFMGDKSRKLKADDEHTGDLASRLADEFDFSAIINEKYKRAESLKDADVSKGIVDCARISQVSKLLRKEFLQKILDAKEGIIAEHGEALVVFIHGTDDPNMDEYIGRYGADERTSILIGYGQDDKGKESLTAAPGFVTELTRCLAEGNRNSMIAVAADTKSLYCGRDANNLSQLFRHKDFKDTRVQSVQLEIKKAFRQPPVIHKTVKAIGSALRKAIEHKVPAVIEAAPDLNLVDRAYRTLAEIFSRHYESAMMEAGRFIIDEFYGGDFERARRKESTKDHSLNELIQKLHSRDANAPSKSWVYNAVNLVVDDHEFSGFHTYGKLFLSHKILLLPISNADTKKKLIKETAEKKYTIEQLRERISQIRSEETVSSQKQMSLFRAIRNPEAVFSDDYSEATSVESLMQFRPSALQKLHLMAQEKADEINATIERLTEQKYQYRHLIQRIESATKQKPGNRSSK